MSEETSFNLDHFNQWIETLRKTHLGQCQQMLLNGAGVDYNISTGKTTADLQGIEEACCLGVGQMLVPGWSPERPFTNSLADRSFREWLGLHVGSRAWNNGDLSIALPPEIANLPSQGEPDSDPGHFREYLSRYLSSAASMNDSGGLTFAQIADCLAYFGLREVPESWPHGR